MVRRCAPLPSAGSSAATRRALHPKRSSPPSPREALPYVPAGATRHWIEAALDVAAAAFDDTVRVLGTGWHVSAQDTVSSCFCLWCAAYSLSDFEEAMWRTVAGMGIGIPRA